MSTTFRNYENFEDYSVLMELQPRQDNLLDMLGIFEEDYHQSTLIELERITAKTDKMYAVARDADRQFSGRDDARSEAFKIPFFTLDAVVRPNELQDLRAIAVDPNQPATVQRSVDRVIARIQRSHSDLHKRAMFNVLTAGTAYAVDAAGVAMPEYAVNFATKWGVTRKVVTQDISDQAVDPSQYVEKEVRAYLNANIQDNSTSLGVVGIVGSGYFNALTKHALVKEAYLNRDGGAGFLTERLSGDAYRRTFTFDGVTYIEEPDVSVVARNKAYFIPIGVSMFRLDYAPANTLEHANTVAEKAYLWVEEQRRKVVAESEVSVLASTTRPELIVEITGTLPAWA